MIMSLLLHLYDSSGNESDGTPERIYTIDSQGPAKVTGLKATASTTVITLHWDDVPDQDLSYFQVEWKSREEAEYEYYNKTGTTLGMYITKLKPSTSYWFRVVAYDVYGNRSTVSDEIVAATTADISPPVIKSIDPKPSRISNTIPLSASASDNVGVSSFKFQMSEDIENWIDIKGFTVENAQENMTFKYNYDVSSLEEGSCYIRGVAADTSGNVSTTASALIIEYIIDRTPPSAPAGLVITPLMSYLSLSWNSGAENDLAYYRLYRAEEAEGHYSVIADGIKSLGYHDRNVEQNKLYYYKIQVVDLAGNESLLSSAVSDQLLPDTQAPVIFSMSCPSYNGTLPANPKISVFAGDNYKLAAITLEYKLKSEAEDKWTLIGRRETNAVSEVYSVNWNTTGLHEDEYIIRAISEDLSGNVSESFDASFNLNLLPPSAPVLSATPGGWKIDLAWTTGNEPDLAGFRLYRSSTPGGSFRMIKETTDTEYTDELLMPGQSYYYKVQALDIYGNASWSNIEVSVPADEDIYAPVAYAGSDLIAAVAMEVAFDATMSSDNDRIESYHWDFGDGTFSTLAQPVHAYAEVGTYYAVLTVTDPAGNTAADTVKVQVYPASQVGTLEIKVVDADTGAAIPGAYVYIDFPDDTLKHYMTDGNGISKLIATAGNYNVAAYKTDYLPSEVNIQVVQYRKTNVTVKIKKGELVVGDLSVRRMELQEIIDAGIDVNAPENQHVYKFSVVLVFNQAPLPVEYIYVNGNGQLLVGSGKPIKISGGSGSGTGSGSFGAGGGAICYPKAVPHPEHPEVPPTLAFIAISESVSWLKEFFEVSLTLQNMADTQFVIADSTATLKLPEGLSLAPTREGQNLTINIGDIAGQETKLVKWIIRGDEKGYYNLDAFFNGTLMPFEAPVDAHFRTEEPFRVLGGDALHLYVEAEDAAYIGESYYAQFRLTNVSDIPIYNLKTTFGAYCEPMPVYEVVIIDTEGNKYVERYEAGSPGAGGANAGCHFELHDLEAQENLPYLQPGDTVGINCLMPGESIYGTYVTGFNAAGDPDEVYYILMEAFSTSLVGSTTEIPVTIRTIPSHVSKHKVVLVDNSSYWADPVDTASGAHIIEREAIAVRGASDLSLDLNYNSLLLNEGTMGKGWNHNFETRLEKLDDGTLNVYWTPSNFTRFFNVKTQTRQTHGIVREDRSILVMANDEPDEEEYYCTVHSMKDFHLKKNTDGTYRLTCSNNNIYIFDTDGRLVRMEDENGKYITISYTEDGKTIITEPVSGQTLTLSYNVQGLLENVSDKTGRRTTFTYNSNRCLEQITDPIGKTTTYTYDSAGRVLTGTDGDGIVFFTNTYDTKGRVVTQDDAIQSNNITRFSYDETSEYWRLTTTVTDRNGNTRKYVHDRLDQLIRVEDELGNVTTFTYDKNGNRTSMTDSNGNTTLYTYDASGNLLTISDAEGLQVSFTYDSNGNVLTLENADGEKALNVYNEQNLLVSTTDQLGNMTVYTYNENEQILTQTLQGAGTSTFTYENGLIKSSSDMLGNSVTYGYDAAGRINSITDREGNTTTYRYDEAGRLLSETDVLGNSVSYAYDSRGNIISETDKNGSITTFKYNGNGMLIEATDPQGNKTTYEYDGEDRLVKTTDPQGNTAETEYDRSGRAICVKDALGNTTSFTYDQAGNILTKTMPGKGVITYTYYKNGRLHTETDAAGNTTTYYYDPAWRVIRITNAAGKSTTFTYDSAGNLLTETDPLGNRISCIYDNRGNIITRTDARGNATSYSYNANNMLVSVTDALNNTTEYSYDKEDRLTAVTDAKGNTTTFEYDKAGKVIAITDALGNTVQFEYDKAGNLIKTKDAYGTDIITACCDNMNRPITETDALGNVTENKYDTLGRLIEVIDALNRTTKYSYDKMNNILSVTDPLNGVSSQTFDQDGNIKSITDPNGNTQEFIYDAAGRLITETTAIGSVKTYGYNELNLLSGMKNGRGQETAYGYDDAGRLINFSDPEGTVEYSYDENGNVLTVTDGTGTITREYDKLNRVTKYTDFNGNTIEYSYDSVGNLIALTYPGGRIVRYEYDAANRLVKVTDWANRITSYEYDKNGRLIKTSRPNGTQQTIIYDAAGNILQQKEIDREGSIIVQYDYTYDAVGNVTAEQQSNEAQSVALPNAVMTYDKGNRLISYNGQAVEYDADGNMIYGPLNGEMASFTYDSRNRLVSAGNISYEYDAENNRIAVIENGKRIEYENNPHAHLSQLLLQKDPQGNITYYVYGLGLIGHEGPDGKYATYHYDRRGSTIALTDITGAVTDTFEYGPYGELFNKTGTTATPFLFNGRDGVMTDSNGLYYMRARYYNPDIKRFINQDVIQGSILNGATLNRYAYANGNPVSLIDPFGLAAELSWSSLGHGLLDIIGIIPGIGDVFDAINSVWYLLEGDYQNAALSFISVLPALGSLAAKGLKWGGKAFKATKFGTKMIDIGSKAVDWGKLVGRSISDSFSAIRQTWKSSRAGKLLASNAGSVRAGLITGADAVSAAAKKALKSVDEVVEGAGKTGDNIVYLSKNADGVTQYVGITNNIARRQAEHLASKGIQIEPLMKNISRSDARAVEQALIEIHGLGKNGGTLINKINSIGKTNPKYAKSLERGYELLKSIGY